MSTAILIIGESGSGKSTSIRTLDPEQTYIFNVLNKPLPFRGHAKKYISKQGGNYCCSDNSEIIINLMKRINEERPSVKNIIIDDFQYIMANEFLKRGTERGYDKFTEIAQKAHSLIMNSMSLRDDINVFFLSHSSVGDDGVARCKTVGKLLDNQITLEGMFSIVFKTVVDDGKYFFMTQSDGKSTCKSPMGMFESKYIENDLNYVCEQINKYNDEDDVEQ